MIYGFGINDSNYVVQPTVNGIRKPCKYYLTWVNMLKRVYCKSFIQNNPTYENCVVVNEWSSFMSFRNWMITQDWVDKDLDKDILVKGNKTYGPDTCVFVDRITNNFFRDWNSISTDLPKGIHINNKNGKYYPQFRTKLSSRSRFLGSFVTEKEAVIAYDIAVASFANELIINQKDERVVEILKSIINQKVAN